MKTRNRFVVISIAIIAALIVVAAVNLKHRATAEATSVPLKGEAAIEKLKHQGTYNSLSAAMKAAKYNAQHLPAENAYKFANSEQGFSATFAAAGSTSLPGLRVVTGDANRQAELSINLTAYGYDRNLSRLKPIKLNASENRIEYLHTADHTNSSQQSAIKEWFINNPDGIEHGFVLPEAPTVIRTESSLLHLRMEIGGNWQSFLETETQTVSFRNLNGTTLLSYGKLHVFDARRQTLPAHFELSGNQLSIVVDDRAAEYPLTVDPVLEQQAKIIGPSGGPFDRIGAAVAISGNTAVVGAPADDIAVPNQGSVYVFTRSGDVWTQQAKISAEAGQDDQFGISVAIEGDTLIAGAFGDDIGSNVSQGSAYVFVRSGNVWTQQQKLTAIDGTINDAFGVGVAISGNSVLVGAQGDSSAYVFTRSGTVWTQQQKLLASDGQPNWFFGHSVALDGNTALIGAHQAANGIGAAYVFTRSGTLWSEQQKLEVAVGQFQTVFGFSVALSGNTAAIGAPAEDDGTEIDNGAAYIFVRNGAGAWSLQVRLNPAPVDDGDQFGVSIALYADVLAVGAAFDDISTELNRGSVYVFSREGTIWTQREKLLAGDGVANDVFGESVAIAPGHLLVGSTAADIGGDIDEGAAYTFKLTGRVGIDGSNGVLGGGTLGAGGDQIGSAVAISGDTAVIGAPGTDGGSIAPVLNQGSAYVFQRNGASWTLQTTLTAPDADSFDQFGDSVAINGNTIVVGAPRDEAGGTQRGSAYVYIRNGSAWSFQQKLAASNGRSDDHFGWSVSISGDTIAVGAPDFDGTSGTVTNSGAIYVFTRSGGVWSQQTTGETNVQDSRLGWSVALCGNTLAAGAPLRSVTILNQGMVRIYTRSGTTWTRQPDITAPDAVAFDQLGISVAISEDENTVVSGAFFADAPNTNQGAAYVFKRANIDGSLWTMESKLTDVNGQADDNFGEAVGISGETVIVGAFADNEPGVTDWGSAFVFERRGSSWFRTQQLGSLTAQAGTFFGGSVDISGSLMVIGAPGFDDAGQTDQGVAFIAGGLGCLTLTVSPATLPNGFVGSPYNETFSASGDGAPSHNFAISGGSLPIGLILSSSGNLSGTPLVAGTFNFTVTATAPNLCSANRSYTVTIQPDCSTFIINPTSQTFAASGGTGSVNVTANDGCSWTATPNANWITLGNFGGTGSGSVGFTVAANTGAARTGLIFVAGHTFTVNQNAVAPPTPLQFYPLAHPIRLLDTRAGAPACDAPGAMIPGGTSRTQTAAGRTCDSLTIPANAKALTGNVTTVESGGGFLTLYPSDTERPLAANSNYSPNQVLNNVFTVGLGAADGAFKIFVTSNTNVVVDITGYYAPPRVGGLYFHPLPKPVRLLDTRTGQPACFVPGAQLQAGSTTSQLGQTFCDGVTIPAGAQALVGNATTVGSQSNGFLKLYPADAAQPLAASSNFQAGLVMNAPFTVGLSPSGQFNIFTNATTDLVIDVLGYYSTQLSDVNGQGLLFNSLPSPVRLLDTRAGQPGCFMPGAQMIGGTVYNQPAVGACTNIPAAAKAVVGNATVVNSTANGFLTFWPSAAVQPLVATSNFRAGLVFNRHFTVGLGADGAFKRFASSTTDLVIDLSGYFAP